MRSSFSKITFTSIFIHQYQVSQNPSNPIFIISAFYTTSSHCILQKHKDSPRIQKKIQERRIIIDRILQPLFFSFSTPWKHAYRPKPPSLYWRTRSSTKTTFLSISSHQPFLIPFLPSQKTPSIEIWLRLPSPITIHLH